MQEQEPSLQKTSSQGDDLVIDFYRMVAVVKIIPFALLGFCLAYTIMMLYFPAQLIYLEVGALLLYVFALIRYRLIQDFIWPVAKIVYQVLTGKVDARHVLPKTEKKP